MQLFSVGIWQLNMDGSKKLDKDGEPLHAYDSTDIMNMARAWTGIDREYRYRGNAESGKWGPHVDPTHINREYRDIYPKADLLGGYIGDLYPLCSDLPKKDHLRKGGTYRLLGGKRTPEMQLDWFQWEDNDYILRLELEQSSPLFEKLCMKDELGSCTFPGKVVLDENLVYDTDDLKKGDEYHVDTIRVLKMTAGTKNVYYEYIRPPCVELAFLGSLAKKVIRGSIRYVQTKYSIIVRRRRLFITFLTIMDQIIYSSDLIVSESVCADPRREIATESCCEPGWDSVSGGSQGYRYCLYHGERMNFDAAVNRCAANNQEQCTPRRVQEHLCGFDVKRKVWSSWTSSSCMTRVKISYETGLIGRVDYPDPDYAGKQNVPDIVNENTKNFFSVTWISNQSGLPMDSTSCNTISSCYSVGDGCVCDTSVTETAVFDSANTIVSKAFVLSSLNIGAFEPGMFYEGELTLIGNCGFADLTFYSLSSSGDSCTNLGLDTFISIIDDHGIQRYLKNVQSTVQILGANSSFRNAPHFISMVDQDLRDMYYETDAVIEHFFHHPSHAPFLTIRMIQRFGISNPSPGFIKRVATAYVNGSYNDIGSGNYGNLAAM